MTGSTLLVTRCVKNAYSRQIFRYFSQEYQPKALKKASRVTPVPRSPHPGAPQGRSARQLRDGGRQHSEQLLAMRVNPARNRLWGTLGAGQGRHNQAQKRQPVMTPPLALARIGHMLQDIHQCRILLIYRDPCECEC
jgi:hypothetical protein